MICMSCMPPMGDAGENAGARASTLLGRIAGAVRRAWRTYWTCRTRQAIVLLLRALDARTLRELGVDPAEVGCPVQHQRQGRHPDARRG
jgi:hypothetical protein